MNRKELYYVTGEDVRVNYKKYGEYKFKYSWSSEYCIGVGNTLYTLFHSIMNRINKNINIDETFYIYENGNLIKKIEIRY